MTEQEAINMLKYRMNTAIEIVGKGEDGKAFEDMEMAIQALEKQTPKKPKEVKGVYDLLKPVCPVCGNDFLGEYCDECGQRIDWD